MHQEDLQFFQHITQQLLKAEFETPVVTPIPPTEMNQRFNLDLSEEGISDEVFQPLLQDLILNTPRTSTGSFFNQLFGGRRSKAVMAELLSVVLNNSMYTHKVAGPMVGVEQSVIRSVCDLIGYGTESDGTFPPGGSMGNFMGMVMARDAYLEQHPEVAPHLLRYYTSDQSHYSISKNGSLMGLLANQMQQVASDDLGRMIPERLLEHVQQDRAAGLHPCFVNATAGTTVMGAFDPVQALGEMAHQEGFWLHVDGAYCGGVIFSESLKTQVKGLELSHSFGFNAHKLPGSPLSCSILVAQNRTDLLRSFNHKADYLYQTEAQRYNPGMTSLQCGRRNDALKFWALWKTEGSKGMGKMVDHQFQLAQEARDYVADHPDYILYNQGPGISVCFNYKGISAKELCTALNESAQLMVGYGSFRGQEFVRMVTINANLVKTDIQHFFETLEAFVAEYTLEASSVSV
ncbi:MAG: pyridoxal phosphate-dependent decarboxylase family protein [Salibacteraceae bacterium]